MASRGGFQVEGLSQVIRDLQKIGVEVDDLKDAFSEIANEGAHLAAQYAPKRSGALASDIRGNRAKSKAVVTAGRSSIPYAGPINYGWASHGIAGAFFMQKASDAMEPVAVVKLEHEINQTIKRKGML